MEREYVIEGLIILAVVFVVAFIFFSSFRESFEEVKIIAEEVFQWKKPELRNAAANVAKNLILENFKKCLESGEKCSCEMDRFNLPYEYQIVIKNTDGGVLVEVLNEEGKIITHEKYDGFEIGMLETREEQYVECKIGGKCKEETQKVLYCSIPDTPLVITTTSEKTNRWRITETLTYTFYSGMVEYTTSEGNKIKVKIPSIYKVDDKTLCFVTNKIEYITKRVPRKLKKVIELNEQVKFSLDLKFFKIETKRDFQSEVFDFLASLTKSCIPGEINDCPVYRKEISKDYEKILESFIIGNEFEILEKGIAKNLISKIVKEGKENNIDPFYLMAIILATSKFDKHYVSDYGEAGILPLKESVARKYCYVPDYKKPCRGDKLENFKNCDFGMDERFKPEKSIASGARYLGEILQNKLIERNDRCFQFVTAAYKAGISSLQKGIPKKKDVIEFVESVCRIYRKITGFGVCPHPLKEILQTEDTSKVSPEIKGKLLVLLDPGHGGIDPGAVDSAKIKGCGGTGQKESDINLEITDMIREELEKYGIDVVQTRYGDGWFLKINKYNCLNRYCKGDKEGKNYVYPSDRARLANDIGATILISNHNDCCFCSGRLIKYPTPKVYGVHGCIGDKCVESEKLASIIAKELTKATGINYKLDSTGCGKGRCGVLFYSRMPSILIEYAPVGHSDLFSKKRKEAMAKAVADGIIKYAKSRGLIK